MQTSNQPIPDFSMIPEGPRPVARLEPINNKWWLAVVGLLALAIVAVALVSISQMKTVVSDKTTVEAENKLLKEQLAAVKTPAVVPTVTPTVKIDETPKAKAIASEDLRVTIAATYGFDTTIDAIKTEVNKAMAGCVALVPNLTLCVKSVALNGGHGWVAIVDKAGGMEKTEATNLATCLKPLLPPDPNDADLMVKKPSLYRSPKCY